MKRISLLLFTIPLLLASYTASAAIDTAGWFYKIKYYNAEESRWVYVLRGGYDLLEDCQSAYFDASVWAEHEFPVSGCKFYYSDEYDSIENVNDLWGIKPIDWIGLDVEQQEQLILRIYELESAYNLQGFRGEVKQLIDETKTSQ